MHRSHWDLEVHARDFQQRRWQEAERRRLVDEAARRGLAFPGAANPFNVAVARLVSAWKARLVPGRVSDAHEQRPNVQIPVAPEVLPQPNRPAPRQVAQPYADMVVIARGPKVASVTEQPCGIGEC